VTRFLVGRQHFADFNDASYRVEADRQSPVRLGIVADVKTIAASIIPIIASGSG
jgi:hypothetical protein